MKTISFDVTEREHREIKRAQKKQGGMEYRRLFLLAITSLNDISVEDNFNITDEELKA